MDDGLLLLVQQHDQCPLRPDVAVDPSVDVVEEADDNDLLGHGRNQNRNLTQLVEVEPEAHFHYSSRPTLELLQIKLGPKEVMVIIRVQIMHLPKDIIGWTCYPVVMGDTDSSHPSEKLVNDYVALPDYPIAVGGRGFISFCSRSLRGRTPICV